MSQNTYLEFNNPIQITWRSGSASDPFVDRLDISKVVNQRISLLEIPDEFYRVRILNMSEINYEKFIKNTLSENEYYVDYSNGFVYFHHMKEAQTISIVYKGRGVILYPSSRILHYDGTNPSENLHDIIEQAKAQVIHLIDETQNFEKVLERMIIATNSTKEATDNAILATQQAITATDLVKDAYKTTVLIYRPFVNTQADIAVTYPFPQVGWTVQVYDTGIRYRWDGQSWIPIDLFGGNVPKATSQMDGLMSKEDFIKLRDVSQNVDTRVVVFVIPQEVFIGVQSPHISFPFDGKILEVSASVSKADTAVTTIGIEKSTNMVNWLSILSRPVSIASNRYFNDTSHVILNSDVKAGDIFRLDVIQAGNVQNLTVNIKIEI